MNPRNHSSSAGARRLEGDTMPKKKIRIFWYINCGCGFRTASLKEAADHVSETHHIMHGSVTVRPRVRK